MGAHPEPRSHRPYPGGPEPYRTDEIPRFKHGGKARVPVPPPRDENGTEQYLRLARTGEMPIVRPEDVEWTGTQVIQAPDPWTPWDTFLLFLAVVLSVVSMSVSGLAMVQVMQLRHALEGNVVVVPADQLTPAPEPTPE